MKQITTNSAKQTFEFAKDFAKTLKGGEIIGLIGDLGAGKTVFAKGLAKGLGVKKTVTSPTFVLMKVYKIADCRPARLATQVAGRLPIAELIHIDAYRLRSGGDLKAIGAEEYFNRPDVAVVIEWADKIKKTLPAKTIFIKFKYAGENSRRLKLR